MKKEYIRVFKPFEIEEIKKGLLILGDLSADCGACRALGLNGYEVAECPECGIVFRYVASRRVENNPGERFKFARRIAEKRPDLTHIDYGDFSKLLGKKKARDFFG